MPMLETFRSAGERRRADGEHEEGASHQERGEQEAEASLRGIERGEGVTAPGVERADLLQDGFAANLAAFGAQSPDLAARYRD